MAEQSDTAAPESTPETASTSEEGNQTRGLQEALQAERKRRQEMEARLSAFEQKQREQAEAEAKKRGEFEALYTSAKSEMEKISSELASYKTKEANRIQALQAENAERLRNLPENFRALVPDGLDPDSTRSQIARLESVLGQATPSGGIPPRGTKPAQEKIPEAALLEAERYGYSDARSYFEKIFKPRQNRK